FLGAGIARKFVAKKCARPGGKIRQQANARAQQIHSARKPRVIARVRTRRGTSSPFGLPQAAALQFSFHFGQQFFDRQPLQILRVEPFEFGPVEDGVRAAYAFERRNSSSPPGDQPSNAKKLRNASGKNPSARYMFTSVAP